MEQRVEAVNDALRVADVPLTVLPGAEIALATVPDLDDDELRRLALAGSSWLLIEPPLSGSLPMETALADLKARGHRLILAHPERCRIFQRDIGLLDRLVEDGVLLSVTAGALSGRFGKTPQRFAGRLLRQGLVHNVASDAHGTAGRAPGLQEDLATAGFGQHLSLWCDEMPAAVIADQPMPEALFEPARQAAGTRRRGGARRTPPAERAAGPVVANGRPAPLPRDARVILYEVQALAVVTRARAAALQQSTALSAAEEGGRIQGLLSLLTQVATELEQATGPAQPEAPAAPSPAAPDAPAPPVGPEPEDVAREMAAEGAGRIEIEDYLRQHYPRNEARRLARRILHWER
jgi:protein-tyrosine phosphatase